jgi:murein DD-endopeptidase MepM/ murein hydrolase activator NlpD
MDRRSFVQALTDKGVSKDQVYRILKAFEAIRKFDKSNKNDKFVAAIDRETKQVKAFEYIVGPQEIYQARDQNGILTASQLDLKVADTEVTGSVYIGKNLAKSIDESGLEEGLTKVIDEAFAGRMSSEGLEEGGTLRVIAIETTALGEFAKYKQIVAIEYHPADPAAPAVRAYSFDGSRVHGYFDEKGRQPDGSGWGIPVPGAPITSHFNLKRMHPILHKIVPHTGTDFGAPSGTPIYAAFKGKLTNFGPAGPCGNMAQIDHPGGIQTGYCHMSKFAAGLKLGSLVGTKQLIGYVGTTGRSTGPHLHFWAKKDGKFFDSETLHMNGMRAMPPEERDGFAARKAELDARLDALPMPEPPPPAPASESKASPKDESDDSKDAPHGSADPSDPDEKTDGDKNPKSPKKGEKGSSHPASKPSPDDEGEDLMGADLGK